VDRRDKAFRKGIVPGVLAAALIWAIGWHSVANLDYPHAVWRCGSTWQIETNGDYVPTASHLDLDSNDDLLPDQEYQAGAARKECIADAHEALGWQIPAAVVLAIWLFMWNRRLNRAASLDREELRQRQAERRRQQQDSKKSTGD